KNKTQLTKIMDSSLDMICSIADDGIILTVSAACEAILGYKPDELIGKQLFDFIYAEDRERSAGIVARVKQGEHITNFENQYVRKDGTLVPLYWSVKWDPKEKIRYGVARDATEKKKSEAALIQSEHLLREAQKMAKIGSWNFDFQSDTLTWSEALYDVFGANRETFKETHGSFVNLVMEEDRDFVLKTSQHSQETGEPFNIVYRIITPSNELRYIEEFGYVEKGPDVVIKRLFGTAQDITERKKIEDELKKSEENYKYLFENSPVPLMVWDVETLKILDCNEEALYSYGYTREEFLNLTIKDIRPTEDIPLIESYIKTMDICSKLDKAVWRHQKKNGEIIFMDVIRHMMKYNGRKVSFALSRDITESYYYLQLDKLEKDILEKSAQDKTSLVDTLSIYLKGIQDIHPGMLCSVQSVRKNRLHNLASRDIPAEFLQQIDGVEIGENKGSCGTSAYLKQKVIVTDINNDVRWESYKVIAARYGLKACWSCPILNTKSDVVATFACYYKEVRTPSEREKNTIERATQILQLILESDKRKHELEHSNQRFAFAAQATSDIIWDWDLEKNEVYYSDNL
ncbi:MAG: PAS domain S-box protein, partial [Mucilaginibacter sp.]